MPITVVLIRVKLFELSNFFSFYCFTFICLFLEMENFEGSRLKQNDSFYLSWMESKRKFCVKKDVQGMRSLPNNHIAVDIKYVSFPAGSSKLLLENIKSPNSKSLLQCSYGVIVDAPADGTGFHIGDKVITVHKSKWVRNQMLIPTNKAIKMPLDLNPEISVISIGNDSVIIQKVCIHS